MTTSEQWEARIHASHDRVYPDCTTWTEHERVGLDGNGKRYRFVGVGCAEHSVTFQRDGDPDPVRVR